MVTPSACSTTLIRTSAGSLRWPRFTATTSTSLPPPDASIDPFTPTISIVLPAASAPCQRKSLPCWAWEGEPARPARTSSVGARRGVSPGLRGGGGGYRPCVEPGSGWAVWKFLARHEHAGSRHHPRPDRYRALLQGMAPGGGAPDADRKSTRLNSSHGYLSYAVF